MGAEQSKCQTGGGSKGGTRPAHCKGKQQTKHRNMNFNERKRVPLGAANINVCIIKGDLTIEKSDVIVCTASKNLDLSRGRASKALLEKAGSMMKDDCEQQYPDGIEYDEIAVVNAGNLPCKKVYFVALPVWGTGHDEQKGLETLLKKCIKCASDNNCESIAFPALGTGLLKYPADKVAHWTLQYVEDFSNSTPNTSLKYVNIIVFYQDNASFNAFEQEARSRSSKSSQGGASGGVKAKNAIGMRSIVSRQMSNGGGDGRDSIGNINVSIKVGELTSFQADVIINNTQEDLQLDSGALSNAILDAAGPGLQEECDECYPHGIQGGEIASTGGYSLKASRVYHGTLPTWNNNKSASAKKPLCRFICNCLKQAERDQFQTLAFPTLGTGSPSYPARISAQTMFECIKKHQNTCSNTCISDIIIVVYNKGDNWKKIRAAYEQELSKALDHDSDDEEDEESNNKAMYRLLEMAAKNSLERTVAPPKGTKDWFKHQYKTNPRSPGYWTEFTDNKTLKDWRLDCDDVRPKRILVDQQTFDAVKKVALETWQKQHVGQGRDAKGLDSLNYSNIRITKVERIENCELFEKYALKRQDLFHQASKQGEFTRLDKVKGSSGKIMTTSSIPKDSALSRDIHLEINEHYMFHGTLESVVDTIIKQGLDCRLGGASAMFGQGVYAAESSTKSDQYADPKTNRTSGEKKMFLIRMCLGKMYVVNQPKAFARAPCMQCYMDKCSCTDNSFFDSVVGDGGWNFREFVVYDRTQVYPEYLISYVRV
ncbi:protein mono-ADP-ribosyltransferase PARP14-like isoform X2 [Ruditapes philippinarum]|uniref:protein mono-ADP-ribosyltransferase PARP14-like isoform X2 n=1 Tax=Ruditapes philippinarum TaxID=129788 RepID=UPI00295BADE1|nr:protein mono-ADP-ribosyltransferase PARP14-like isoform X2 [Ruditapes philippinarum]